MNHFLAMLGLCGLMLSSAPGGAAPAAPLDINSATVEQLIALPGIGRKRAEQIIELRKARPYRRTYELLRVRGIGRSIYRRIKPHVRIGQAAPQEEVNNSH